MKISEISIKNFRSFDESGASITLGEMAAFVGKNSSGKSNILQALQLFWGQYTLTTEDFYYGETDRTISISVTFSVASEDIIPALLPYVSSDGFLRLLWTIPLYSGHFTAIVHSGCISDRRPAFF